MNCRAWNIHFLKNTILAIRSIFLNCDCELPQVFHYVLNGLLNPLPSLLIVCAISSSYVVGSCAVVSVGHHCAAARDKILKCEKITIKGASMRAASS